MNNLVFSRSYDFHQRTKNTISMFYKYDEKKALAMRAEESLNGVSIVAFVYSSYEIKAYKETRRQNHISC